MVNHSGWNVMGRQHLLHHFCFPSILGCAYRDPHHGIILSEERHEKVYLDLARAPSL